MIITVLVLSGLVIGGYLVYKKVKTKASTVVSAAQSLGSVVKTEAETLVSDVKQDVESADSGVKTEVGALVTETEKAL